MKKRNIIYFSPITAKSYDNQSTMKTLTKPQPLPTWETDLEIERTIAPPKPQRTVHPAIIIAVVDAIIMLTVPSLRLYAGLTLAGASLVCIAVVGAQMIRRAYHAR